MNRKMKARLANAQAKAAKIRADRKRKDPDICPDCGDPVSDHEAAVRIGNDVYLVTIEADRLTVDKSKLN